MNLLRGEIEQFRNDRNWALTYQSSYEKLVAGGLIGDESRLEWRALMVALGRELKLPDISIKYVPRRAVETEGLLQLSAGEWMQVSVFASTMTFDASLLHSGDLLTLLYTMDHNTSAILMPKRCLLKLAEDPLYLSPEPLIRSQCELNWLTLLPGEPGLADGGQQW